VAWDTTVTVVDAINITLGGLGLGWLANLAATLIELLFLVPVFGPILQWIWNIALTVSSFLVGLLDAFAYSIGIRPQKKLRVCTVIFADSKGNPVAAADDVVNALNATIDIYFREMNVLVIRSAPFQYSTGFLRPPAADASWITTRQVADDQLTACCNQCMAGEELWLKGSARRKEYMQDCFWGNWRRLMGLGSPVAIFVIRNMESRTITDSDGTMRTVQTGGCGLGPLTDFVTIAATAPAIGIANALQNSPATTAHELGHICNLWHLTAAREVGNLMFANDDGRRDASGRTLVRTGTSLFDWQAMIVRSSRHVSYV
jgi:hypothetical protein